jgi:hypothetical protein
VIAETEGFVLGIDSHGNSVSKLDALFGAGNENSGVGDGGNTPANQQAD